MSAFASLSGSRVTAGSVAITLYGLWCGDVSLAAGDAVPTNGALVLGNLSLKCHTYRTAMFAGSRQCRLVAGVGGWRETVRPKPYYLASGVNLSMVLGDAAREVGERVNVPNDTVIGNAYARERGPASRVLRQLAGENWYMDPDGVTQIRPWPTRPIRSPFTVEDQDGGAGRVTIATEDYAAWLPGATFSSPFLDATYTVCGVLYRFADDGTFRLEVLTQ